MGNVRPLGIDNGEIVMSGMYGADVAQLRALAQQFDTAADRLEQSRLIVGAAVGSSAWAGPDASRFRSHWDGDLSRRVVEAAGRLRDAARSLRVNADDQEATSAVDGRPSRGSGAWDPSGLLPALPGLFGTLPWTEPGAWLPENIDPTVTTLPWRIDTGSGGGALPLDVLDRVLDVAAGVDAVSTMSEIFEWGFKGPSFLGPLGAFFDSAEAADAINKGDGVGAFLNIIAAGTAAIPAVNLGVGAFNSFVDATLPYNTESVDETYAKGVEHMFGREADPRDLSADQAQAMAKRYDPPWGVARMISDRMDATADKIFPWNMDATADKIFPWNWGK